MSYKQHSSRVTARLQGCEARRVEQGRLYEQRAGSERLSIRSLLEVYLYKSNRYPRTSNIHSHRTEQRNQSQATKTRR